MSKAITKEFFIINTEEERAAAANYVAHLRKSPVMCVEVKPYSPNRSVSQNRLMWMWLGVIAKEQGYEPEELHEILKVRFLGIESKMVDGQVLIVPKSTTALDVKGMSAHLMKIEALAVSLEINLPKPDDYRYAMMY